MPLGKCFQVVWLWRKWNIERLMELIRLPYCLQYTKKSHMIRLELLDAVKNTF